MRVYVCDKGDIGGETSANSSKLIHGGLRYLETYEFGLVRKALQERQKLLKIAPHITRTMEFVLPHAPHLRPAWFIRCGLFIYDLLAWPNNLSFTRSINKYHKALQPLRSQFKRAFIYTDGWVDDHRLVILNALDAQQHGAQISPFNACNKAYRRNGLWVVETEKETIQAKVLINAAGPWAQSVISDVIDTPNSHNLRLVKGSHIIVPKLFDHNKSYIFQNDDGRIIFTIPYEEQFTLIGTTDIEIKGKPSEAVCSEEEQEYLCDIINSYFKQQISPKDIVATYSGVRPLIEDENTSASKASRDYRIEAVEMDECTLINIWGGKITTYRILAEQVLDVLEKHFDKYKNITTNQLITGSNKELDSLNKIESHLQKEYPWLPRDISRRYARTYGTNAITLLKKIDNVKGLGFHFGAGLYAAEVNYLTKYEWAKDAESITRRRTKLYLQLSAHEIQEIDTYINQNKTA